MMLFPTTLILEVGRKGGVQGKAEPVVVVADLEEEKMRTKSDYPFPFFMFDVLRLFYLVLVFFF